MSDERGREIAHKYCVAHNTRIPGTWPVFETWLVFLLHVQEAPGSNFVFQDQLSRLNRHRLNNYIFSIIPFESRHKFLFFS
jgi:hypothetical protein